MIKEVKIQRFMTSQLGLSGNYLVLFAICWKESNGGKEEFALDYNEVSQAMGTSIPTMYNCVDKLIERGYVEQQASKGMYRVKVKTT